MAGTIYFETEAEAGAVVSFDDASSRPLKSLVVDIAPVQSGSGDPSPDNIRPITGWSEAKVTRTGKNLLDMDNCVDDLYIANNGKFSSIEGASVFYAQVAPNSTYVVSCERGDRTLIASYSGGTPTVSSDYKRLIANVATLDVPKTFTTNADEYWIAIYLNRYANTKPTQVMLRLASDTDPTYEPYSGQTFTISLGDTRYGAELDATRGKLMVTHRYLTDNGTLGWTRNLDGSFYVANPDQSTFPAEQTADGCSCNYAPFVTSFDGMAVFFRTNGLIALGKGWGSIYADATALKTAFASTPIQFVYKLATPIEVDLTPTEITTLLGLNNVWADIGNILQLIYYRGIPYMVEQRIKANVGVYSVPAIVHAVQEDTARLFIFELEDYQIDGTETASLMCVRPDGSAFSYAGVVDSDTNTVAVPLYQEGGALSQVGNVAAQLVLAFDGAVLCSFKMGVIVEEKIGGEATQDDITFLAGLQAQLDQAIGQFVESTRTINGVQLNSNIVLKSAQFSNAITGENMLANLTYTQVTSW